MNKEKKYLGVDWGTRRIGLSLAQESAKVATPWKTVNSKEELFNIIKQEEIDVLVLGVPYKMFGREAEVQREFQDFFQELKNNTDIEIKTVDERLSSKNADSLEGNKKNKASRDASSAMLILQQYLDSI